MINTGRIACQYGLCKGGIRNDSFFFEFLKLNLEKKNSFFVRLNDRFIDLSFVDQFSLISRFS